MIAGWKDWLPAALTVAGLGIGLAASIRELNLQRFAHGDAAALVNGRPIAQEDVERALASVGADRRAELTRADRQKVLERLIEDELLAQRAIALGLPETDPNARKVMVRALIDSLTATAPAPSEMELRTYFDANKDLFRSSDLISIEPVEGNVRGLPSTPMTIDKLKDYLGGSAEVLADTPQGGSAGPFTFAGQQFHVRVTARLGGQDQPFEQARDNVLNHYVVLRDGKRLRSYIDSLKRSAKIERIP
jgi:hypothetical protein